VAEGRNVIVRYRAALGMKYDASKRAMRMPTGETCYESEEGKDKSFIRAPRFYRRLVLHGPPLWSSGQSFWPQIQRTRVRSPALPDFLSSSGSGTWSTQPREVKLRSYLNKKVAAPGSENRA